MLMPRWFWLALCLPLLTSWSDATEDPCPWDDADLSLWSEASTWPDKTVPGVEAEVTITGKVLLDVQPPALAYIRVAAGGSLVWGDVDDITLNVTYILVEGSFHVGSEHCRFTKRATINLYGLSNNPFEVSGFGRKFIGVASGGTLELHGQDKMSWTKLAHTIPAGSRMDCAFLYNHLTTVLGQEKRQGLHVMVFDSDGSVFDFNAFNNAIFNTLPPFLASLPDGVVVAAAVRTSIGNPPESVLQAFERLGSKLIRSVTSNQPYTFIARTGDPTTVQEAMVIDIYTRLFDPSRLLEFRVASLNMGVNFQVMDGQVARPKITVIHDVSSWNIGDEILVTSTDFEWRQAEVKKVVECIDCAKNQIRLDSSFDYMHFGEITHNVDERGEVALLTRNILIKGQLEEECYNFTPDEKKVCARFRRDMFGGHIKALHGSTIHVEGVELYQMGQQKHKAAYPLHLHIMNDASGMWLRNNSIHQSNSRCITIHGSHNADVSDNVCYMHVGHGFFLEDSVEQNNTLNRNLGVGTMHGTLLLSDKSEDWCSEKQNLFCDELSTFWLTHPNNVITNNVAAGGDGSGFHYVFASFPIGVSRHVPFLLEGLTNGSIQYFPLTFDDNVAHSNFKHGLFFDSQISAGEDFNGQFVPENGILPVSPIYDPRDPPHENGTSVWAEMRRCTLYKNEIHNAWIKAGNIRITQSSLADAQRGLTGGTLGINTGTEIHKCLFVGITGNKGEPQKYVDMHKTGNPVKFFNHSIGRNPYESWTGVGFYQGPMLVDSCHFSQYKHDWWADEWQAQYGFRPVRPGGGISFQRDNAYPSKPWSYVKNVTFDYCDDVDDQNWVFMGNASTYNWSDDDGNKALTFHDLDGSVTGQAGTQVVIDRPFYSGPDCVLRPTWQMTVCPYKYVQFEVLGKDGVLAGSKKDQRPLIVHRDDVPDDKINLDGTQRNKFLARTHKSYTVNFNSTLGTVPMYFDVRATGLEKGDVLRVGLCLPKDTTQFEVRSSFPFINERYPHSMATSLQELNDDLTGRLFYWDAKSGMLYFKFVTNETRQSTIEECANGQCPRYKITRLDGGDTVTSPCTGNPPVPDTTPAVTPPLPKACPSPLSTAQGIGAPITNLVTAEPFNITCRSTDSMAGRSSPEHRGCFSDKGSYSDVTAFKLESTKSMTREFCQDRCYYRGYLYSALTLGKRCTCGDWFGLYGEIADNKCTVPCSGDPLSTCGAGGKLEVYTTGLAPTKPVPERCGPNNMGIIYKGSSCLYLQLQLMRVADAQRLCVRLGGNLVAIRSQDKQTFVEQYLREHHPDTRDKVWTGLNHAREPTVWEQMDGTLLGDFTFWRGNNGKDRSKHFVYLAGEDGYMWAQTKDVVLGQPLCDLPLSNPPHIDSCGEINDGIRLAPGGPCYKLMREFRTRDSATYACHTAKGKLATFRGRQSKNELIRLLYGYGEEMDYWVARQSTVMKWKNAIYVYARMPKDYMARAICELEITNNTHRCPSEWISEGDSCYLYLGAQVKTYSTGAALCENEDGNSNLVTVESESENNFLVSLVGSSNVLLGMRYSPRYDDFIGRTGNQTTFSAWKSGNGKSNLENGLCAVVRRTGQESAVWMNAKCTALVARVVCEMPAL